MDPNLYIFYDYINQDSDRSVVVQFVDFGNRDFAEISDLKLLPTDALIPPALATRGKSSFVGCWVRIAFLR